MPPVIVTERLRLRPFQSTDANLLFELDSDPEVMRFLTGGVATSLEVIERRILPRFIAGGYWAAELRATAEFVGWFSLNPIEEPGVKELGYRLRRSTWGMGLATEGGRAMLDFAFSDPGTERITAHTYQDNHASRRVMEKLGLRFVRSYRITAEELIRSGTFDAAANELWDGDDVEYGISRETWQK